MTPRLLLDRLAITTIGASLLALALAPAEASAYTAYRQIYALATGDSDYVKNYDFASQYDAQDNVDWPVSILAYNGASIDRFKYLLENQGFGSQSGNDQYGRASDGGENYRFDGDGGKKGVFCPSNSTTPHYRVYADGDQYLYNTTFGTYVYATTHRDRDECGGGNRSFYDSEGVEGLVVGKFGYLGYPVYHDQYRFYNYNPYRVEGDHIWDNDGNGSYVNLRY